MTQFRARPIEIICWLSYLIDSAFFLVNQVLFINLKSHLKTPVFIYGAANKLKLQNNLYTGFFRF